ncbi:hypothetical protein PsorP6_010800 [Peronosclerospora sorghi]|uniref:Uncharacterized protein n=1 Tax=Peronosclerospora sorghi TaxID=230839 RepID=A0ACC0VVK5_9STRA|nr:hypothetical protein PsorP6_010800 [Peronosclerospora sorghi]
MPCPCSDTGNTGKRRFPLRGIERFGISEPDVSVKCCHALTIRGDMDQMVHFLPMAVMRTFNRHPRLRALIVKDEKFTAEVQPHISLDDVADMNLLRVRELSNSSREDVASWTNWIEFVRTETTIPFDRFKQFMFYLTVWVNRDESKARFFLFSDHILSDGDSGQIFVNDTLESIALLSIEAAKPVHELPLRPSLYDIWFASCWWIKPVLKTMIATVGGSAFVDYLKQFKPLLTPREDQKDFGIPFQPNSTTLLYQKGTPSNMRDTLRMCKEMGIKLTGALVPIVMLAYYHARNVDRKLNGVEQTDELFRLMADMIYNMRERVPHPCEERQIGLYVAAAPLRWLATNGINMKTAKFWDLARISAQQVNEQPHNLMEMAMPLFLMDRKLIKPKIGNVLGDFKVPNSCTGDATISNIGRYLYKTKHILASNGVLEVEDFFGFCDIPFVATSSTLWITSVHTFNYSLAHKVDEKVGSALFKAYVKLCENLSCIRKEDTMEDVLNRLL